MHKTIALAALVACFAAPFTAFADPNSLNAPGPQQPPPAPPPNYQPPPPVNPQPNFQPPPPVAQPVFYSPPPQQQQQPPPPPSARNRYATGVLLGAAVPLHGDASTVLGVGFTGLISGSLELVGGTSLRAEAGYQSNGRELIDTATAVYFNVGGRYALTQEGTFRPYVGAHVGYHLGLASVSVGSSTTVGGGGGFSAGFSAGTNIALSDTLLFTIEARYVIVLTGIESVYPGGGFLNVLAGATILL
jgi:opacity protein-like surface antigen